MMDFYAYASYVSGLTIRNSTGLKSELLYNNYASIVLGGQNSLINVSSILGIITIATSFLILDLNNLHKKPHCH